MKSLIIPFLFFLKLGSAWKADQHPVQNIYIISSFGETKSGGFSITSEYVGRQNVHAISDGVVLYRENRKRVPIRPRLGRKNYAMIQHKEGIRSYYLGLNEDSIFPKLDKISSGKKLGQTSFQNKITRFTMRLMIEDSTQKKIINPLVVLPTSTDNRPPIAGSVFVVINENTYSFKNNNPTFRYRGEMKLYGIARDHIALKGNKGLVLWPKGIKRVSFYIDDEVWRDYDFDYLLIKPDGLKLPPDYSHDEIYGVPFNFKFGQFIPTKQKYVFELVCEDWMGNRNSKKYRISFK